MSGQIFLRFSLCLLPPVLSLSTKEKSLAPSSMHIPFRHLYTLIRSNWTFYSPGWTTTALIGEMLQSLFLQKDVFCSSKTVLFELLNFLSIYMSIYSMWNSRDRLSAFTRCSDVFSSCVAQDMHTHLPHRDFFLINCIFSSNIRSLKESASLVCLQSFKKSRSDKEANKLLRQFICCHCNRLLCFTRRIFLEWHFSTSDSE